MPLVDVDVDVRGIAPDELEAYWSVLYHAFSEEITEERISDEALRAEVDRMLGAFDGDRIVGTAGAYSFELTLPGGATVPVAGVTAVAVLPTHRRRGILRAMMARQLDDVVERGEPMAVLTASESPIYGRFGYGLAARAMHVKIDTYRGLPTVDHSAAGGSVRLAEPGELDTLLPLLHDELRRRRVGEVSRPKGFWDFIALDREHWREGASKFFTAVHVDDDGRPDGVIRYRVKQGEWSKAEVQVDDVIAPDEAVELALLHFAADVDLTGTVSAYRPVDDPLRYQVADWRSYKVVGSLDHLYARVLDVERVLSTRTYGGDGELTITVDDPFRPEAGGTFRLASGGGCERVGDDVDADIQLGAAALGSLVLGDVAPSTLAAAGRLTARGVDALRTADRLFVEPVAPFCSLDF